MPRKAPPPALDPYTNQALARLAGEIPQAQWLAWVDKDGLLRGIYPETANAQPIPAVTAAMLSLGERISTDLEGGGMHYILVKGVQGMYVTVTARPGVALLASFFPETSPDSALAILQGRMPSLIEDLRPTG